MGVIDLEIPAREPRSFGGLELHDGRPALQLDTVLMSVFYPTEVTKGPRLPWLNRPASSSSDGYARFGGIVGVKRYLLRPFVMLLGAMTRVPATLNAPIASTQPRPLMLFSQCVQ